MDVHHRDELANHFRQQAQFAAEYSPLSSRICTIIAERLAAEPTDSLGDWLVEASQGRNTFEISLLLMAGLHRDILAGIPCSRDLSRHYATAGGSFSTDSVGFGADLQGAILPRRKVLAEFIQKANVQTNETGRGIAWLLPLSYVTWDVVHLVDLGASAGLNLVADRRAYRLENGTSGEVLARLGMADSTQFVMRCANGLYASPRARAPQIASRTGCDVYPFLLNSSEDELTLASFIWGDQPERLHRLREGIAAFHQVNAAERPIALHAVSLPDDLTDFLEQRFPDSSQPVVIYNTYITAYLEGKGRGLRRHIERWAGRESRPVLWLQWEPPWEGHDSSEYDTLAWTADLWLEGVHRQWQFGWVHPHGTHFRRETGFREWAEFWDSR